MEKADEYILWKTRVDKNLIFCNEVLQNTGEFKFKMNNNKLCINDNTNSSSISFINKLKDISSKRDRANQLLNLTEQLEWEQQFAPIISHKEISQNLERVERLSNHLEKVLQHKDYILSQLVQGSVGRSEERLQINIKNHDDIEKIFETFSQLSGKLENYANNLKILKQNHLLDYKMLTSKSELSQKNLLNLQVDYINFTEQFKILNEIIN